MSERRFLVEPLELAGGEGGLARVAGDEHHHLSRVLRLQPGDAIWLFNGAGAGCAGVIESIEREQTVVRMGAPDRRPVEPALSLTLAQGVPHHDKMDLIVQKCTELGVARFVPILAQRSVMRPRDASGWSRLERWARVARDAARQSGRLQVPAIAEPLAWDAFLGTEEARTGARWIFSTMPGAATLPRLTPDAAARTAVAAVGPEGGFTEEEVAAGIAAGFTATGLGARTLRAETAAIVATALILDRAGDLGGPGSGRDRLSASSGE